jgi:peptidoglycan/xylan/chitin deacetylase (PgdA/CDA1 family)
MSRDSVVYLMYHELELPNRPLCQSEPGYVRYIVSAADFRDQMQSLKSKGRKGISVSAALAEPLMRNVALTFDDGCETDLITAAPLLAEFGFSATFYVTVGFLGQRGYMTPSQVRQLCDRGFEIGSHSLSHPYLSDLANTELERELTDSKKKLEEMTGRPVVHFSCPGGRYDARVSRMAQTAGYQSVTTSQVFTNSRKTDPYGLGRVAIMRGTSLLQFQALSEGHGLLKIRTLDSCRAFLKRILGNTIYDRLRAQALDKSGR